MTRRIEIAAVLFAAAGMLASTSRAHALPTDTYGFGSRSMALGGAVAADVQDFSANYYNPAGLVRGDEVKISFGYQRSYSLLSINGIDSQIDPLGGINLGIVAPIPIAGIVIGFGLGIHLNDQRLNRTRSSIADRPRWELYDTRPQKAWIGANFALRLWDWLHLGGGITFQGPAALNLQLRGNASLVNRDQARLEHQVTGNLESIRYPQAGLQIVPTDWLSFGLAYRGAFTLQSNTNSSAVDFSVDGITGVEFEIGSTSIAHYGPMQVILSTVVNPVRRLRLGFDLTFVQWSKHPSFVVDEFFNIVVPASLADSLPTAGLMGRTPIPLNLRDRWVPRAGVEYTAVENDAVELQLRLGYSYENSPYPMQAGVSNYVDNDRHQMSLGVGLRLLDLEPTLPGWLRIDAHVVYGYLPDRQHIKTSIADPVGDYVSSGNQIGLGFNLEAAFQ